MNLKFWKDRLGRVRVSRLKDGAKKFVEDAENSEFAKLYFSAALKKAIATRSGAVAKPINSLKTPVDNGDEDLEKRVP